MSGTLKPITPSLFAYLKDSDYDGARLFCSIEVIKLRFLKNLFSLSLLALICAGTSYVSWLEPRSIEAEESFEETSDEETFKQHLTGIHFTGTKSVKKDWELWSDEATGSDETNDWELKKVKAIFYTDGEESFTVLGDVGQANLKTENIEVVGNVIISSSNGYVMKTSAVDYDSADRVLSSRGKVEVVGPRIARGRRPILYLTAGEMTSYLETSVIELNERVVSWKTTKDNKKIRLNSDRAELSGKNNSARFLDNVRMRMDDLKVLGPEAILVYSSKQSILKKLHMKGGIRMKSPNRSATSKELEIFFAEDLYKLLGAPRLVQNEDELRGREIIFSQGGQRVQVIRARAKVERKEIQ